MGLSIASGMGIPSGLGPCNICATSVAFEGNSHHGAVISSSSSGLAKSCCDNSLVGF